MGEATTHQTVDPTDKGDSQNDKEGRDRCFFIQNHMWPNENHAPGKQHACNDSLKGGDGPHLLHGLSVVNTYTEVISGSKQAAVLVKNLMAIPITITKGVKVVQVVAVDVVPPWNWHPECWRG